MANHAPFFPFRLNARNALLLVSALLALLGAGAFFEGRVVSVPDGDTLEIFTGKGTRRVRLYGVDCPELSQKGGEAAKAFAERLALYSAVRVDVRDVDPYGRDVAVVSVEGGGSLNELLVEEGHAWVFRSFCKSAECPGWYAKEAAAREAGKNLWADPKPTPPWKWRASHRR